MSVLILLSFGGNVFGDNGSFFPFWRDDFSSLKRKSFSASEIRRMREKAGDAAKLDAMLLPASWMVSIDSFPAIGKFECLDGQPGMRVIAPDAPILLRTRKFRMDNYAYRMTVKKSGAGQVELAGEVIGETSKTSSRMGKFETVPAAEGGLTVNIPPSQDGEFVRFHLRITGDAILLSADMERMELPGLSVCEGTITARSILPDPAASEYPDCNYTADCELHSILSGESTPRNVRLIVPGFRKNRQTSAADLKTGGLVRLRIIPEDSAAFTGDRTIQESDTLPFSTAEVYRAVFVETIPQFTDANSARPFTQAGRYESVYGHPVNPCLTEQELAAKQARIEAELARVKPMTAGLDETERAELNKRFWNVWRRRAEGLPFVGPDHLFVWGRVGNSFFALPADYVFSSRTEIMPYNLAAVKSFDDLLSANGIRLVIQVMPELSGVAARALNPEFRREPDDRSAEVVRQLLEAGVEAVYSSDRVMEACERYPLSFFYPDNGHPHDGVQDALTSQAAEYIRRECPALLRGDGTEPEKFSTDLRPTAYEEKYCWPEGVDIGENKAGDPILCETILYDGKAFRPNSKSPILIAGNSVIQTPMDDHAYTARLAQKLGCTPDTLRISGFGPFLAVSRAFFKNPDRYMKGKKLVWMPVSATYFQSQVHFLNLRELDRFSSLLSGLEVKKNLTFPGTILPENTPPVPDVRHWDEWRIFLRQSCACVRMDRAVESVLLKDIPIPWDGLDASREIVCCLQLQTCCRPHTSITLSVNGEEIPIPPANFLQPPEWQYIVVKIPPGVKSISLKTVSTASGNLIAFRGISLYQ